MTKNEDLIEERKEKEEINRNMKKLRKAKNTSNYKMAAEAINFLKQKEELLSKGDFEYYSNVATEMTCMPIVRR